LSIFNYLFIHLLFLNLANSNSSMLPQMAVVLPQMPIGPGVGAQNLVNMNYHNPAVPGYIHNGADMPGVDMYAAGNAQQIQNSPMYYPGNNMVMPAPGMYPDANQFIANQQLGMVGNYNNSGHQQGNMYNQSVPMMQQPYYNPRFNFFQHDFVWCINTTLLCRSLIFRYQQGPPQVGAGRGGYGQGGFNQQGHGGRFNCNQMSFVSIFISFCSQVQRSNATVRTKLSK
jgi:hypothetical protein